MPDDTKVSCGDHGEAYPTYICKHLVKDPAQRWHSGAPSEDSRWPDAWCSVCNIEFLKEGEWNEKNEQGIVPEMICHLCYEQAQAQSLDRLAGHELRAWKQLVVTSIAAARDKADLLEAKFQIGRHKRWDWNQENAQLVFSNDGVPALICDIAFVGSVSTLSNTWLWSWANFGLDEAVRKPMERVREFGELRDFPKLVVPKWPAEETDGWEMAAIAIETLGAQGIYRTPSETGFTFLAILDARWAQ